MSARAPPSRSAPSAVALARAAPSAARTAAARTSAAVAPAKGGKGAKAGGKKRSVQVSLDPNDRASFILAKWKNPIRTIFRARGIRKLTPHFALFSEIAAQATHAMYKYQIRAAASSFNADKNRDKISALDVATGIIPVIEQKPRGHEFYRQKKRLEAEERARSTSRSNAIRERNEKKRLAAEAAKAAEGAAPSEDVPAEEANGDVAEGEEPTQVPDQE